jgi:1,4-alpha-glucan branching enzyme
VIFDVVYNHAGGGFDDQSLWFLDRQNNNGFNHENSLYFTRDGWAGGLVFDYAKPEVRRMLADNARFLLEEYHGDGLRYDEVTVIDRFGGWVFCQQVSGETRTAKPQAIQIAEYWNDPAWRWIAVTPPHHGMGFDGVLADRLRDQVRETVAEAAHGQGATVHVERLRQALQLSGGVPAAWRQVQCIENHDIVYADREPHEWTAPGSSRRHPCLALLVRAKQGPRRNRPAPYEPRYSDALHGPGDPGAAELDGQP